MRLLVIEDESRIAQNIRIMLTRASYAVDLAPDGETGLQKLLTEDYDLAILDWQLPGKDGVTVCREARKNGFTKPVLMLTSRGQIEDKVEGLDSGADDYLVKPFAREELLARVRVLLRRKTEPLAEPVLRCGTLAVNINTQQVTLAGQTVELAPREYALLEYLIRHADQVVSREAMLTHVWDEHADPFSNTVDVHIRYLRQKLKDESHRRIKTVKGKGYLLCPG